MSTTANQTPLKLSRRNSRKPAPSTPSKIELTVSWTTLLRIIVAGVLVCIGLILGHLMGLIFLALLVALTLWKIVAFCRRRGLPHWVGVAVSAFLVLGFVALFAGVLIPTVASQGSALIEALPKFQKAIVEHLPTAGPARDAVNKLLASASFSDPAPLLKHFMAWGVLILGSLAEFLIVLVIAIYFLVDGERIYEWLVAFLPERHRSKVRLAAPQIARIVSRYTGGQLITSLLCGSYAFVVLFSLHVPNAALFAVLAGLVDILPVIGFFTFILPAIGVALTVSPFTAGAVAALYGAYHLAEVYWIVPKVYGDQLKLSTLTVLLSCLAGWLVAGVVGAICILPVVASYPIIEKIWLKPHLEPDTVTKHSAIEEAAHPES